MHAAIREDPVLQKKERSKPADAKSWKPVKLTYDERKANLKVPAFAVAPAPHPHLFCCSNLHRLMQCEVTRPLTESAYTCEPVRSLE